MENLLLGNVVYQIFENEILECLSTSYWPKLKSKIDTNVVRYSLVNLLCLFTIIPARSGSKRFPNKNIHIFLNIPLFYHSIFCKKLKFVKKIIFSTDSEKYIRIAKKF